MIDQHSRPALSSVSFFLEIMMTRAMPSHNLFKKHFFEVASNIVAGNSCDVIRREKTNIMGLYHPSPSQNLFHTSLACAYFALVP
jgi:hypothetical protein